MQEKKTETKLNELADRVNGRFSRAQLLKAAGAGALLAAAPGIASASTGSTGSFTPPSGTGMPPSIAPGGSYSFPFYPQVSGPYAPETIPTILNIAQTMEYLATTYVNAGVTHASAMGITGLTLGALQAALAEEVYHVQFLASVGATPMTTTFTLPDPAALTNATVFFQTLEMLESICTAAYITATREFAELAQPLLAKFATQAGVVEGEHRVTARTALALMNPTATPSAAATPGTPNVSPWTGAPGTAAPMVASPIPPNNKAFATDYFVHLADAAALVTSLGFIGGTGTALTFPGTSTALTNAGNIAGAVQQQLPNNATTSATSADVIGALYAIGVTSGVVARGGGTSGTS